MTADPNRRVGLSRASSALAVIGALAVSGIVSRRYSPDPTNPGIRRWYKRLDKPAATPPDPVFGAAWPVLLTGLGMGAYRLLLQPDTPARNSAVALAGLTLGLVTAYSKITFGDRDLSAGALESKVLVGVAAAYVVAASETDRTAAALGVPLLLWSSFGTWLTVQLKRRNRALDSGAG